MERFQEEAMAWQAKKQNSSNKCCKDLVGILKDNEHEDNEISEDEDDTAWDIYEILGKNIQKREYMWHMWSLCMSEMCTSWHRFRWQFLLLKMFSITCFSSM